MPCSNRPLVYVSCPRSNMSKGREISDYLSISPMIISAPIFEAYLKCPSKCWSLLFGKEGDANIYSNFMRNQSNAYRAAGIERLMVKIQQSECVVMLSAPIRIAADLLPLPCRFPGALTNRFPAVPGMLLPRIGNKIPPAMTTRHLFHTLTAISQDGCRICPELKE